LNGANPTDPIALRAGTAYRFRIMNITLGRPNTRIRLTQDAFPVQWLPIAKDGFDLPPAQQRFERADRTVAVGETYDYRFRSNQPVELRLEFRTGGGQLLVEQVVRIVEQ
jgi:hypothetical protein